jgi:hypothetical protein
MIVGEEGTEREGANEAEDGRKARVGFGVRARGFEIGCWG